VKPLVILLADDVTIGDVGLDSVTGILEGIAVLDFPADYDSWFYVQVQLDPADEGVPLPFQLSLIDPAGGKTTMGEGVVQPMTRPHPDLPPTATFKYAITLELKRPGVHTIRLSIGGLQIERLVLVGRM